MSRSKMSSFQSPRWLGWASAIRRIEKGVLALRVRQRVWHAYREVMDRVEIPASASIFHDWLVRNYADAQNVGIRRLVDRNQHARGSLYRLIFDIAEHAADVSRENFILVWNPSGSSEDEERAGQAYDYVFHSDGPTSAELKEKAKNLRASVAPIVNHVNKRVAHTDPEPAALPTWQELDDAVDTVDRVFMRFYLLLTCNECAPADAVLPAGWERAIESACRASVGQSPAQASPAGPVPRPM